MTKAMIILITFGEAHRALEAGKKVAREGWNGKGMWIMHVPGTDGVHPKPGTPYYEAGFTGPAPVTIDPHIDMFTARGTMQPGWQPTQADMLAKDWHIV